MEQVKQRTILIADDDPSSALLAEAALSDAGYRVLIANGGEEALQQFGRARPDCLVLDVMMPDVSGFDVCRRVRALPDGRHVPILMLTNLSDHASISESYNAGASDFTQKGRNPRLLVERVRFLLRDRVLDDEWRASQTRFEQAERIARVGHWELTLTGQSITMSPLVCELLGRAERPLGNYTDLLALLPEAEAEAARQAFLACAAGGPGFACDHRLEGPDGRPIFVHQEAQLLQRGDHDAGAVVLVTLQDVTRLKPAEDTVNTRLYTDIATGLPNRRFYEEQLALALASPRGTETTTILAVRIRNLDRAVASHGEGFGSALIAEVSGRVAEAFAPLGRSANAAGSWREDIVVARIAGDELGVLLRGERGAEQVAASAVAMLSSITRPVVCVGIEYVPVVSAGIAVATVDGAVADDLMRHAHIAANQAADVGSYSFYSAQLQTRSRRHLSLKSDLRVAIEGEQLHLAYQPRVRVTDRGIAGVEALLRWQHPRLGAVSPAEFVPIAEESGTITTIGRWALETACDQLARWRAAGWQELRIAVNLSPMQLVERDFATIVQRALTHNALPADALELEVTESCIITADDQTRLTLDSLRAMGVRVALDDFGTGYSSFGQIRRFPVDCVKLDRSLIADLRFDRGAQGVVAGVLAIARALGIRSCAEGVEDAATLQMLADLDCDEVQGHYLSQPLRAAELETWIANGGARSAAMPAAAGALVTGVAGAA